MKTRNSHGLLQLHVGREALAYCQCLYRENKALLVSVDLIGEKNQVILEFREMTDLHGVIFYSNNNGITIHVHVMYDLPR